MSVSVSPSRPLSPPTASPSPLATDASCTPLALLLSAPRAASHVVCVDGRGAAGDEISLNSLNTGAWLTHVRAMCRAFVMRSAQRLALCLDDPLDMGCALLAAWATGKTPVVLPNSLAQTRSDFAFAYDEAIDAAMLASMTSDTSIIDADEAQLAFTTPLPASSELIIYTSGSTGEPKAITKSLAQLNDEVQTLHRHWGSQLHNALVVASVPCHHIYGLWFRVLWPLAAGVPFARHTFAEPAQAQSWRTWPATVWIAGPAQLTRWPALLDDGIWADAPRLTFSSGGPLPADAAQQYATRSRNARADAPGICAHAPVEVFGSTETGGIAWRQQDSTSDWTPLDDTTVRVADGNALEIRSPRVNDGQWWRTDDGAVVHANGTFTLTGRLDRIVKIEGKRLALPSIEAALMRHEWVDDVAAVVVSGRLAVAIVLSQPGRLAWKDQTLKEVRETLRQALAQTFDATVLPRRWRFLAELPVNERGKRTTADVTACFSPASAWLPSVLGVRPGDATPGKDIDDGAASVVMALRVPPDLAHFKGHFPGLPLLPGVVLVDWATRFATQHALRHPALRAWVGTPTSLQQIKFTAPVLPGTRLELTLTFDAARHRVQYVYDGARGMAATGYLAYPTPPTPLANAGDAQR